MEVFVTGPPRGYVELLFFAMFSHHSSPVRIARSISGIGFIACHIENAWLEAYPTSIIEQLLIERSEVPSGDNGHLVVVIDLIEILDELLGFV